LTDGNQAIQRRADHKQSTCAFFPALVRLAAALFAADQAYAATAAAAAPQG